jgi:hypothetical protein
MIRRVICVASAYLPASSSDVAVYGGSSALAAIRKAVCVWLDEHQDGTLAQMVDELRHRYLDCPEEMVVVLRGIMAAELRRRTSRVQRLPLLEYPGDRQAGIVAGHRWRALAPARFCRPASPIPGGAPDVQFTSPTAGRYGQYVALIPPGSIPEEAREITVKSPDLCGLMDQLDDLFGSPDTN